VGAEADKAIAALSWTQVHQALTRHRDSASDDRVPATLHVCFWHLADIDVDDDHVCFWE
jgi:hypothetical protein